LSEDFYLRGVQWLRLTGLMSTGTGIASVAFDNGLIARSVGLLCLAPGAEPDPELLRKQAAAEGWAVVYLRSPSPLPQFAAMAMGETVELRGEREPTRDALSQFTARFPVRTLAPADWDAIAALYRHASLTRFSRDPRIGRERALRHKLACLREYARQSPEHFLVAEAAARVVGFQGCLAAPDRFDVYESLIDPAYRTGFALADLLRENLARLAARQPGTHALVTRIYADNRPAIAYYEKLGWQAASSVHWYHLWTSPTSEPGSKPS